LPVSDVFAETKDFEKDAEKVVGKKQGLEQTKTSGLKRAKELYSQRYYNATVHQVQKRLKELGYNPGSIDGVWGKQTESAIRKFQSDNSLSMTGRIDSVTKNKLGLISAESSVLKTSMTTKLAFDFLLYGVLLTIALYHFCLFGIRRKENSSLYFGCLCILIAFLYMRSAEKSFIALFPNFDWEIAIKIEFISIYLGFTIFVMFISSLYPAEFSLIMLRVSQGLGALFIILTLVTSVEIHTYGIIAYGVVALVLSIYSIYVLIRAILRKREGSILFLTGFLFLFTVIINDIFYDQSIIYTSELVPLGVFIVIFSQSFILSLRFSKASDREVVYERFVPKEFLKNLNIEDIADVKLGDNAQITMSILFSDIRNFTTLSEQMTPEQNFKFINSYLNVMGPVIRRHHGFIDKFIGDAIMALFDKGADDAVRGAIGMLRKLVEYNEGRKRADYFPIGIGIGINTGTLRIGTIGERGRMEGTVISDAVNVASRIEGMTKTYGVSLLISDETFRILEDPSKYHIRKIDQVKAKGKTEPVTVWEVFDADPSDILNYKLDIATVFEDARSLYQSKRFEESHELFLDCLARNPKDKTAALYKDRCNLYMKMDVDENMEGIVRRVTYERGL
jgi:class 3 adenylate cyclase